MSGGRRKSGQLRAGGGGGGTGTLAVGPSFGQSEGGDDSTLNATATVALLPYGLIYDLTTEAVIDLVNLALVGGLGATTTVDLTQLGLIYDQLNATAAVDLASLDLVGSLDVAVNVAGAIAVAPDTLSATAAVDLSSLSLSGPLDVTTDLAGHLAVTPDTTQVNITIDLESLSASAALDATTAIFLSEMELIDYLDWADVVVLGTGYSTTSSGIDKDVGTRTICSAASSGIGGLTSNTTNGDLQLSFPDFASPFTDFTLTSVVLEYKWGRQTGGTQIAAGAVNMGLRYSVDDGGAYTLITTATGSNTSDSADLTLDLTSIADTWTKITQFRFRCNGTVESGTGSGKTMLFGLYYARLRIQATRTF